MKEYAWSTAIGLQVVDGLKPSKYLIDTAIQNIEGKITIKEAQYLIDSYYEERPVHLNSDDRIEEVDKVSSRIAEIHIFGEGNTRTTAVFFIKYLRRLGFSATNDIFAENAWYFRNALVRANYTNLQKEIYETTEYLDTERENIHSNIFRKRNNY